MNKYLVLIRCMVWRTKSLIAAPEGVEEVDDAEARRQHRQPGLRRELRPRVGEVREGRGGDDEEEGEGRGL